MAATPRNGPAVPLNVYDSQGVATPLSFYFEKNGANTCDTYNQLDDLTTSPPTVPAITGFAIADKNGAIAATLTPVASSVANGDPALTQKDDFPTDFTYRFYGPDATGASAVRETTLSFATPDAAWDFTYSDAPANTLVALARLKDNLVDYAGGTCRREARSAPPPFEHGHPGRREAAVRAGDDGGPSPANPNSPTAAGSNPAPSAFPVTLDLEQGDAIRHQVRGVELSQDGYTSGELIGINAEDPAS